MAKPKDSKTRAERFKTNLRKLIDESGLTQKAFAEQVDVPYGWVRKSCNDGIARWHPKNEDQIKAICEFFGLESEALWGKQLETKQIKSKNDLGETQRWYVDRLTWLLKEFPDDRNVAKVKGLIDEVVSVLYRPPEKPQEEPLQEPKYFLEPGEKLPPFENMVRRFLEKNDSSPQPTRKRPISTIPSREVNIRKKKDFCVVDKEYLDEQIDGATDGSVSEDETKSRIGEAESRLSSWLSELELAPTPENMQECERLLLTSNEFLRGLPKSLTKLFDKTELRNLVIMGLFHNSPEKLRKTLNALGWERRRQTIEPKLERKRIRRPKIHKDGG